MVAAIGEFDVSVTKKQVVAAVLPIQQHWLPLSNLDLLLPPVDVGIFFCYKKPGTTITFSSMTNILKTSLSQTLVTYYPFSGEVVPNSINEPELLCNNRGVDFVEAVGDIELIQLNLYNPDVSIEGKLVPSKKDGVFAVQVTELKCGGIVVGCTFDHRIADAYSANMFVVSWSDMARSRVISKLPSFRRSLLNPRRPGCTDSCLDDMYVPVSTLDRPKHDDNEGGGETDELISRIYYITEEQLEFLQAKSAVNGCKKRTKMESFCAFLWKMVAMTETSNNKLAKMGIVVNGRTRLSEESEFDCYFGNVLSIPFGSKTVKELNKKPLNWVSDEVHAFLEAALKKEHFLGLIDWVETLRPEPAVAKIYASGSEEGPAFVVSSGRDFPVKEVDFGWGKAVFGSYHFPWGGKSGYVMPMPSARGNGDWIVYMHLLKGQMEMIESKCGEVFKPLSSDYLLA